MWRWLPKSLIILTIVSAAVYAGQDSETIRIEAQSAEVGRYEKLELLIHVDRRYDNPFDPDEVDLVVVLNTPDGGEMTLPAFFCQDYERRKLNQGRENWFYPVGSGTWKARFAPMQTGSYSAAARLKDKTGTIQSPSVRFECVSSANKGFIRVSEKDPRFMELSDGEPFFAIGQNLAFVGEGQYVTLSKAEEIFGRLAANGANFLRIWTCCEDWAMAIEAKKSAWDRSWSRKAYIVPVPGDENGSSPRKCIKIDNESVTVSPSHSVALRPNANYTLTGRFMAEKAAGLRINLGRDNWEIPSNSTAGGKWQDFKREFTTGENDFWLGQMTLGPVGSGTIWLESLSLKETPDGPELLWEADVNRPVLGVYNQVDCFMLDELVEAAQSHGIYLMLCMLTRDLYMKHLTDDRSDEYETAIQYAKKFMRYAVARWGYSTSVAAWEYFNEIDPGLPTDRFYAEVGDEHVAPFGERLPSPVFRRRPGASLYASRHGRGVQGRSRGRARQGTVFAKACPEQAGVDCRIRAGRRQVEPKRLHEAGRRGRAFPYFALGLGVRGHFRHGDVLVVGAARPAGRL
jgi:hypothetical protein